MSNQPKPRSKAKINQPPDFARIKGRIERLEACIAKHKELLAGYDRILASDDSPQTAEAVALEAKKSVNKIEECQNSIAKYKGMAADLKKSVDEILA